MSHKTALVMRATGSQGKGAVKHLVRAGWQVHCLVRDSSSDRALALKSFGPNVSLHQGTWKDASSIESALKGCSALLLNLLPSFTDDAELQEAVIVLKIAKESGIEHVVFPTTVPLNNPNFREDLKDSAAAPAVLGKADVEELVKSSGMIWTLLRPGYFMTNFLPPFVFWMFPEIKDGKLVNSYGPDCILGLVDPEDIGAFVAAAFENPTKFSGQTATVVGQNMRVHDVVEKLREASGCSIEAMYRSPEETERLKSNPFIAGHLLTIGLDKFVDMEEVKSWDVKLTTFDQFISKHQDDLGHITSPEKYGAHITAYAIEVPGTT